MTASSLIHCDAFQCPRTEDTGALPRLPLGWYEVRIGLGIHQIGSTRGDVTQTFRDYHACGKDHMREVLAMALSQIAIDQRDANAYDAGRDDPPPGTLP